MGQEKSKTLQASLIDFCFFSANPSLLGSFALLSPCSLRSPFQGCLRHSVLLRLAVVSFLQPRP
jgi:hypothetical protein